jgi:flavin reductase (DIM6/NTAB) family NADH-FMN oxidoreductase RutF
MMEETDLVGILTGDKWDKSEMFTVFNGVTGAPMIEQCPLCLECEVHKAVDMDTNTLFIGEIKDAFAEESALTEGGNPDLAAMDPLLLTMPDNRYWSVGQDVGKAWKVGRGLQVRLEAEGRLKKVE